MKQKISRTGLLVAAGALLGIWAALTVHTQTNSFAATAPVAGSTYLGVGKCKMCHQTAKGTTPAIYKAWSETKHGKINTGVVPIPAKATAEVTARHMTGAEKGITCEACHGPSSKHMMSKDKKGTTVDPASLDTPAKKISLCGRCHGQYSIGDQKFAAKYQVGDDLLKAEGFKLAEIEPGKKLQEMNELVKSSHFAKGVTCITCHTSHAAAPAAKSLKKPVNQLCLDCHKTTVKDMATHAPKAAADATCATCHMPKGMHTFAEPEEEKKD